MGVSITARTAGFEAGMRRAGRSLDRFSAKTKTARTNVSMMADRLKLIAGTGIIFGAVYGFARLIANVERFNQAMQESTAIMRGLTDQMRNKMRQAALEMAKTVRFSAEELARAFYFLTSAGLSTSQTLQALPAVARFAQAGMFDVARATEMLTDAQSALGMKMKDANKNYVNMVKVSDALIRVTQLADATTEQFAQALTNRAAAAMRMYNIPLAEGIAMLAVFANQNLKAEIGGRAFDIVLRDLSVKATQNAAAFEAAGIAVFDLAGNFNYLPDIIEDLERAYAGLSVQEIKQLQLMLGLQQRAMTVQNSLIGMSQQVREYTEEMERMGGATQDVADNQLTDFTKAWERLKGVVMDSATGMQGAIDDLATSLQYLIDLAEGFPDATEKLRRKQTGDKGWLKRVMGIAAGGTSYGVYGTIGAFADIAAKILTPIGIAVEDNNDIVVRNLVRLRDELYLTADAALDIGDKIAGIDTGALRFWPQLGGGVEAEAGESMIDRAVAFIRTVGREVKDSLLELWNRPLLSAPLKLWPGGGDGGAETHPPFSPGATAGMEGGRYGPSQGVIGGWFKRLFTPGDTALLKKATEDVSSVGGAATDASKSIDELTNPDKWDTSPIGAWRRAIASIESHMLEFGGPRALLEIQDLYARAEDRFAERTGPRQRSQEYLDQVKRVNAAMTAAKMGPALSPEEIVARDEAEQKRMKGMIQSAKTWATEIRTPFEILIDSLKRLKAVASEIDLSSFGNVKNLQRLRDMRRGEFRAAIGIEEGPGDILKQQREQLRQATARGMFSPDEAFKMRQQLTERFIEQQGGTKLDVLAESWFTQTRQPDEIFIAKLEEIKMLRTAGAFTEFAGSAAAGTELYQRAISKASKEFKPKPGVSTSGFISSSQAGGQAGANVLSAASTVQAKELKEMEKQTKLLQQLLREQQAGGMRE